jgi:hypothetical protein
MMMMAIVDVELHAACSASRGKHLVLRTERVSRDEVMEYESLE